MYIVHADTYLFGILIFFNRVLSPTSLYEKGYKKPILFLIEICTDSFDFLVILAQLWAKLPQSAYLAAFSFGFPPDFHNMITAGTDEFGIMRDYQNGSAASCCLFQFLRNQSHVLSIKTTGWFIKDQNPALRKDRAGYG